MAFRARVNPASLRRRVRAPTIPRPPLGRPPLPLSTPAAAGPGPATLLSRGLYTTPPRTSLRSFLGFREPTDADHVVEAATKRDTDLVTKWQQYINTLDLSSSRRLTADETIVVLQATEALRTTRGVLQSALSKMAAECYTTLPNHERTPELDKTAVLVLAARHSDMALNIASGNPEAMGREEWDALTRVRRFGDYVDRLFDIVPPDDHSFYVLLEQASKSDHIARVEAVMANLGVKAGPWTEVGLARAYTEVGLNDKAEALVTSWPQEDVVDDELRQARWRVRVAVAVNRADAETVRMLSKRENALDDVPADALAFLVLDGLPVAPSVPDILAGFSHTADLCGYLLPPDAWDQVLLTLLERDTSLDIVWNVNSQRYSAPGGALAAELIHRLTAKSPPLFNEALQVYTDATTIEDAPTMHIDVFYDLLLAAITVEPTDEVREAVLSHILIDMSMVRQRLGARFAHKLVRKMWNRFAVDHPDACGMYDAVLSVSHPLSREQWEQLLLDFVQLSFPNSAVPTPELLVRMIGDMRAAGFSPGSQVLTKLLWAYADMAKLVSKYETRGAAGVHRELLAATRDVQALLNLDAGLEVNLRLLTALMCALQACGAYDDAFNVWAEIVRMHKSFPADEMGAAVAVMLDACGHAERVDRGLKVWAWASRRGFANNEKDWEAYIEMLARNNRFHEAVDAVAEMKAEMEPNYEIAVTPMTFARGTPHFKAVRRRLADLFPEWHNRLFDDFVTR
ncbi:hypothetical protein CcaverHIS002_0311690 [Cutaneotrichosporon cavernicola]|uniref:Uncharacterized protein n=1 Tax=Cutaneotrichosporon cavernicola TaxID=279322 RepID=A0AA48L353_9TREE|nr:uncharacterized protein CcaverHIS019_0311560 [Cutaneotrichosporon cavernicola]BEI83301.1 hypothetical protein CcaverHIS002_0311690 [Cutaneotrichosporon cavernicola]BEI91086.1 hypothetical protein CcaverHIS019_0311560 [Cutaneotrichosporon cavernicola]BEI98863.1 hypothetical protein CcaverHIS631_0311620 [Cutaneotrichosporon cavernicola]BEJ06636.1 hypothetical protein CcaverHIS641_0311580 [Cutaneotrichosporon cavernicola]